MKFFLAAFFLLFVGSVEAQTVIHGTVTDGNGRSPVSGQAHFGNYNDNMKQSESYACAADGSYSFTVDKPGMYLLRFSAVDHEEASVPIIIQSGDKNIELDARLKPNPFNGTYDRVTIIGDWNKFEFAGPDTMVPTTKNDKTIFTYTRQATGDTLSYQLLGVAGSHSVNGTNADYYSYDGGGDYRSVLRTKPGQDVTITFDPSKWNYEPNEDLPEISVKNDPFLEQAVALSMKADEMYNEARVLPEHGGPITVSPEKYKEMLDYIRKAVEDANARGEKQLAEYGAVTLAGEYLPSGSFSADAALLVLHTVPATSTFWAMKPMDANSLLDLVDTGFAEHYRKEMEKNPERLVQAYAYANEMSHAFDRHEDKLGNELYAKLKADYSDVSQIKYQLTAYDPDAPTRLGKHVPPFEVTLLNSSHKVSDKTMLGRYYMI
ncbi:MAG TPA: carboxypeptidase-like regulatory domain-containing protein, partial [Candidatus Kapabacteria bacterium]